MVRCCRARSSCDSLPNFLLVALRLLVSESLRPSVGDFGVAASENEEFPSFTCSAGGEVLRGGKGAGNRAFGRHMEA